MAPKQTTQKQKKRFGDCRECLICGGKTISAHLGMDVCRACSVFYRRSGQRVYECRSGTNNCEVNKGDSCRKCRLERIEKMLGNTTDSGKLALLSEEASPDGMRALAGDRDHAHRCEPSSSNASTCCAKPLPILEKVRASYSTMCQIRLTAELLSRPEPPHPMLMNEGDFPLQQATVGTMDTSNRIFLSTVAGFGKTAFQEFVLFSREHQWSMVVNFLYRFGPFESSYRAQKAFPNEEERIFAGYTYWNDHNYSERFFRDCPNPIDVDVISSMHDHCKHHHTRFRVYQKRLNLSEPEFIYIAALMFWSVEGLDLPESVNATADRCKTEIMHELHVYFKDERGMDDYAARLGELLTVIQMFDKSDAIKENFEFLRLMNVFTDDTFMYRLQRENTL